MPDLTATEVSSMLFGELNTVHLLAGSIIKVIPILLLKVNVKSIYNIPGTLLIKCTGQWLGT